MFKTYARLTPNWHLVCFPFPFCLHPFFFFLSVYACFLAAFSGFISTFAGAGVADNLPYQLLAPSQPPRRSWPSSWASWRRRGGRVLGACRPAGLPRSNERLPEAGPLVRGCSSHCRSCWDTETHDADSGESHTFYFLKNSYPYLKLRT